MRRTAAVLTCFLVLAACGGGADEEATPAATLDRAEQELAEIDKASMQLSLLASAGEGSAEAGFEVKGPFDVDVDEGELPVAELTVTRIAGDQRQSSTLVSTGSAAFVRAGGKAYKLGTAATDQLRASKGGNNLEMSISDWFVKPRRGGDGRVTGELDVVRALNDVFVVAAGLGAEDRKPLEGDAAERVRSLVRESSAELTADDEGRPSRVTWSVVFAPEGDEQLQEALGDLSAAALRFDFRLSSIGKSVRVEAPANAQPAPTG